MLEPIAAALSYEKSLDEGQEKTILVGGTSAGEPLTLP